MRPTSVAVLLLALVLGFASVLPGASQPASASSAYDAPVDLTFPVAGPNTFIDDYDHCRGGSGCPRRHRATDIMADYGQHVHAAVGGRISFITGMDDDPPPYGYMISIAGDDGRTYNYIHLGDQDLGHEEAYAPGMARGIRVERGQHIGFNGHSGNASRSAPHLHFEIVDPDVTDPYGSNRMNPYASLTSARQRGDVPGAASSAPPKSEPVPHPIAGDWDGSGTDGIGWWHEGVVRLRTASGAAISYRYGRAGDIPVVGDWNGDGVTTLGIVRDGEWHLRDRHSDGPGDRRFTYGRVTRGDVPITGDWNGDGTDTIGIIRDGEWHLRGSHSAGPAERMFIYGRITRGDRPLIGDWNDTGLSLPGVVREGTWHLRFEHRDGPADLSYVYGRVNAGDVPLVGDWNGDGHSTPAIVRGDEWHLKHTHGAGPATRTLNFPAG